MPPSVHRCNLRRPPSGPTGLAPLPAHAQGLLNLLGGGGGSASTPLTNTSGPLCGNLSLPVRSALGAVPAPAANKLCDTLLDGPIDTCNLGAMVEWGLTSTASAPPKCNGLLKQVGGVQLDGGHCGGPAAEHAACLQVDNRRVQARAPSCMLPLTHQGPLKLHLPAGGGARRAVCAAGPAPAAVCRL